MSDAAPLPTELRRALMTNHVTWQARSDQRDAAVLLPVVVREDGAAVLFIKRRDNLRHHAGQYAFPGGQRDGDEAPMACALREFAEELGLPSTRVDVLGSLPCHTSGVGFLAHPFVGQVLDTRGLQPQVEEVELVLEVPLLALRDDARWQWRTVHGAAESRVSPFFTFGEHVIWGLTARIAHDLLERWP